MTSELHRLARVIVVACLLGAGATASMAEQQRFAADSRLIGRVVDPAGNPVSAAYVGIVISEETRAAVTESSRTRVLFARTDPAGRFELLIPETLRSVTLVARATNRPPAYSARVDVRGSKTPLAPIQFATGVEIKGRVIDDESHGAIANAAISVVPLTTIEDTTPPGAKEQTTKSGAAGNFVVAGLQPASYAIHLQRDGFAARTIRDVRAPSRTLTLAMYKATYLMGRVVDASNAPIPNAELVARPSAEEVVRAYAGKAGEFRLGPFAKATTMELIVSAPGFTPARNDSVTAPNGDVIVVLQANGTFRGRVLDEATGKPIEEFRIEFHRRSAAPLRTSAYPGERTFSSKDGRFVWTDVHAGVWTVSVESVGYEALQVPGVRVQQGAPGEELQLFLKKGYTLQGRVFDAATGEPVKSAIISYEKDRLSAQEAVVMPVRPAPRIDKDGVFELSDLPFGRIFLTIHADGYSRSVREVVTGQESFVEIGLARGAIVRGRLFEADGITATPGAVTLFEVAAESFVTVRADQFGAFEFTGVAPGRYTIEGGTLRGRTDRKELVVGAGQQISDVTLRLARGGRISGTVSGLMPGERGRSHIEVVGAEGYRSTTPITESGDFRVDDVPAGRLHVEATTPLQRSLSKTLDTTDRSAVTVDFSFPTEVYRVSGRITRGGKPVPFFAVTAQPLDGQEVSASGESSQSGQYSITGLASGAYLLQIQSYATSRRVVLTGNVTVDFDLSDLTLSGKVTDESDSAPVSGAKIEVRSASAATDSHSFVIKTAHDGTFSIAGLTHDPYRITAYKAGYELLETPLTMSESRTRIALAMRRGGIEMRVVDAVTGAALERVAILEKRESHDAVMLDIPLDGAGVGQIPANLAGRSVVISHIAYENAIVQPQSGAPLQVRLVPAKSR